MPSLRPILLVEDNPNDVELTLAALREANIANPIDIASDGEQALDYLFRRGAYTDRSPFLPVAILLDLKMPKIDGHEVLQAIRSDPNLRFLPVVILTSSREECDLHKSYHQGTNAYVVKPVDFEDFNAAIKQLGCFWALVNEPPLH